MPGFMRRWQVSMPFPDGSIYPLLWLRSLLEDFTDQSGGQALASSCFQSGVTTLVGELPYTALAFFRILSDIDILSIKMVQQKKTSSRHDCGLHISILNSFSAHQS